MIAVFLVILFSRLVNQSFAKGSKSSVRTQDQQAAAASAAALNGQAARGGRQWDELSDAEKKLAWTAYMQNKKS